MKHDGWMIYGANGYTGRIIAEQAAFEGKKPLLAGRSETKIKAVAEGLNLPWCVFDLESSSAVEKALQDVSLVLHCAGPFSATSRDMLDACLKTRTHYLDISGEIAVFESIRERDREARDKACVVMPGVGFDVVPTDCLAVLLSKKLPDATHLELAFCGEGAASPGTVKTMIEMLGDGGRVRRAGQIVKVRAGYKQKKIRFSDHSRWCMTIPWGDISTAFYSTGIGNIEVYTAVPRTAARITRWTAPLMSLVKLQSVQAFLKKRVEKHIHGPDAATRQSGVMHLWARVSNARGECKEAFLDVPEGYQFTVNASLAIVDKVLADLVPVGVQTPSSGLGGDFITSLQGVSLQYL